MAKQPIPEKESPYGRGIGDWVAKASVTACNSKWNAPCIGVALLPNQNRETDWWNLWVQGSATYVSDVYGRIHFEINGEPQPNPRINNCVVVWLPGGAPNGTMMGPSIDGKPPRAPK